MSQARPAQAGVACTAAVLLILVACGRGEAPTSSGSAMVTRPTSAGTNRPPEIQRVGFSPSQPEPGQTVTAVVRASDPDGDAVQLGYRWVVDGKRIVDTGATIPMPTLRRGQVLRLTVIAGDGREESAPVSATLSVGNLAPRLLGLDIETRTLGSGPRPDQVWFVEPQAEDPDGDVVSFRYDWLVNDRISGSDTNHFSKARLQRGDRVKVRVVPMDAYSEGPPLESAVIEIGNAAPEILSTPPGLDASGVFRYRLEVEDRDGDTEFGYRLEAGPPGMRVDPARGELSWKPSPQQTGRHSVKLTVDDGHGGLTTQSFFVAVRLGGTSRDATGPAAPR
jgi:hypothetical protein